MAKSNLEKELNEVLQAASGSKAIRKFSDRVYHVFHMNWKDIVDSIMEARDKIRPKKEHDRFRGSKEYKQLKTGRERLAALYQEDRKYLLKDVQEFATELMSAIATELNTKEEVRLLTPVTSHTYLKFGVTGTNPYLTLKKAKEVASKNVFNSNPKWKTMFEGETNTNIAHVGHQIGVIHLSAAVVENTLSARSDDSMVGMDSVYGGIDMGFQDRVRSVGLKAYQRKMQELAPNFSLGKYKDAKIENGKLVGVSEIGTDLQGDFENSVMKANLGVDEPFSEKEIRTILNEAIKEAQKAMDKFYRRSGAAGEWTKEGSPSLRADAIGMLVNTRSMKKVRGKTIKVKKYNKNPKSTTPKPVKKKGKPVKIGANQHKKAVSALGFVPTKGGRNIKAGRSPESNNLTSLPALINAKLPQTVARNMGPPGLENRTGRFASSVRVTDVTTTPQGYPSVGYTYRQNPYQVFEMGRGDPRWATPERDPRKLIDASIREIAAQFAIGRFYTRRL